jgi:hypothetical protein
MDLTCFYVAWITYCWKQFILLNKIQSVLVALDSVVYMNFLLISVFPRKFHLYRSRKIEITAVGDPRH